MEDNFWEGKELDEVFEELARREKSVMEGLAKVQKEVDEIVAEIESGVDFATSIPQYGDPPALFQKTYSWMDKVNRGFISSDDPEVIARYHRMEEFSNIFQGRGTLMNWVGKFSSSRRFVGEAWGQWSYFPEVQAPRLKVWVGWDGVTIDGGESLQLHGLGQDAQTEGEFKCGRPHGFAMSLKHGFKGIWKDGMPEGPGILRFSCGTEFRGIWSGGRSLPVGAFYRDDSEISLRRFFDSGFRIEMGMDRSAGVTLRLLFSVSDFQMFGGTFSGDLSLEPDSLHHLGLLTPVDDGLNTQRFSGPNIRFPDVSDWSIEDILRRDVEVSLSSFREIVSNRWGARNGSNELSVPNTKLRRHGKGLQRWTASNCYEGEWWRDKRNGQGIQVWTNGDRYEGEWKDDKRSGAGLQIWANGDRYEGEWKDDKRSGKGLQVWANGDRYEGHWAHDSKHGRGTLFSANGDCLESEWQHDSRAEGRIVEIKKDGERFDGAVIRLRRTRELLKHGKGVLWLPDGSRLEGHFDNDKLDGLVMRTESNGDSKKEYWIEGRRDSSLFAALKYRFRKK